MSRKSERIGRFAASVGEEPVFVGVDVHKRSYSVALFCATDGQVETWNCPADESGLAEQLRGLGCYIEHVAYESGPTGFSLCRTLREAGLLSRRLFEGELPGLFRASRGRISRIVGSFCLSSGGVSGGRRRVKPLCGSSASLRPFG